MASSSGPATVEEYLDALPDTRRDVIAAVRAIVLDHLPSGYEEGIQFGMIGYYVPLARYPKTYNGRPLSYVSLASQKNHEALYLMGIYADPNAERALADGFRRAGKKLDMGKSCVRFKKLDDLAIDAVGRAIASVDVEAFIARYEASRADRK